MTTKFITPPDQYLDRTSVLIMNALETELATLLLWLKTVEYSFNIHLYHSKMPETDWAIDTAKKCKFVVVSKVEESYFNQEIQDVLFDIKDKVFRFGPSAEYDDLVQLFLAKSSLTT